MSSTVPFVLGERKQVFVTPEATFGTLALPTANNALKVNKVDLSRSIERRDRVDSRQTRSLLERINGRISAQWSVETFFAGSGTAGIAPDLSALLRAAMGAVSCTQQFTITAYGSVGAGSITVTINGVAQTPISLSGASNNAMATALAASLDALTGVSASANSAVVTMTYDANIYRVTVANTYSTSGITTGAPSHVFSLSSTQGALGSVSVMAHTPGIYQEAACGCLVEEAKISISGADIATAAFSGPAKDVAHCGYDTVTAVGTLALTVTNPELFHASATMVARVKETGTSSPISISSIAGSVLTVDTVAAVAQNDTIEPYAPAETTYGSPAVGVTGTISSGATGLSITAMELSIKNNIKAINDIIGTSATSDYVEGWRVVSGSLSMRATRESMLHFCRRQSSTTRALTVTCGAASISMPAVEFDASKLELPEQGEAVFTLPFTALATGNGDNELTITFT